MTWPSQGDIDTFTCDPHLFSHTQLECSFHRTKMRRERRSKSWRKHHRLLLLSRRFGRFFCINVPSFTICPWEIFSMYFSKIIFASYIVLLRSWFAELLRFPFQKWIPYHKCSQSHSLPEFPAYATLSCNIISIHRMAYFWPQRLNRMLF